LIDRLIIQQYWSVGLGFTLKFFGHNYTNISIFAEGYIALDHISKIAVYNYNNDDEYYFMLAGTIYYRRISNALDLNRLSYIIQNSYENNTEANGFQASHAFIITWHESKFKNVNNPNTFQLILIKSTSNLTYLIFNYDCLSNHFVKPSEILNFYNHVDDVIFIGNSSLTNVNPSVPGRFVFRVNKGF
jgi:hypothetical protein